MALPEPGRWLLPRWLLAFIAFPPAGLIGHAIAGPADAPLAALLSGLVAGAIIGIGQGLALGARSRDLLAWTAVTAVGLGAALAVFVTLAGAPSTIEAAVALGVVSGLAVGAGQAGLLTGAPIATRAVWAGAVAVAWAAGWFVTTSIGVDLAAAWPVYGASGAITSQVITGVALFVLVGRVARGEAVPA